MFEGRRLTAPRVTDRPRLVGWSSLCHARRRRLTSLVVVTGTVPPVPLPAAQLVRAPPLAVEAPGVDPRDQDRPACAPCGAKRVKVGTPSVVSRVTRLPRTPTCACLVDRECHAGAHTVLTPRLAPAACVSTPCGAPLSQRRAADLPCGSSCFATRDASDRLLPSHVFVRAPAPRGFPNGVTGFRSCAIGESPGSRQGDSLRRAAQCRFLVIARGVVFPSRRVRTRL